MSCRAGKRQVRNWGGAQSRFPVRSASRLSGSAAAEEVRGTGAHESRLRRPRLLRAATVLLAPHLFEPRCSSHRLYWRSRYSQRRSGRRPNPGQSPGSARKSAEHPAAPLWKWAGRERPTRGSADLAGRVGSARWPISEHRRRHDELIGGDRSKGLAPREGFARRRVRGIVGSA